jgi:hypothetical protein
MAIGAAALMLACGGGAQQRPAIVAPKAAAHDLESGPFGQHGLSIPSLGITAQVEASAPPTIAYDNTGARIRIPFGDSWIPCRVERGHTGRARQARLLGQFLVSDAASKNPWVDVRGDQAAGWSYVMARALYAVQRPKGEIVRDNKMAISMLRDLTLVCFWQVPGNYAAFERMLRTLLGSLQVASGTAAVVPRYQEIHRASTPGRSITMSYGARYEIGNQSVEESSMIHLAIETDGELGSSDGVYKSVYRDGKLVRASHVSWSNDALAYAVELDLERDIYRVKGTVDDAAVSGQLEIKGGFLDAKRRRGINCDVRDGRRSRAEVPNYVLPGDPLVAQTAVIEKASRPDFDIRLISGGSAPPQFLKLDQNCEIDRARVEIGEAAIERVRLWHEGSP